MSKSQSKKWYDRIAKMEKYPRQAWLGPHVARLLEKESEQGYELMNVTNDSYAFTRSTPKQRKYFVMTLNGYKKSKQLMGEWFDQIEKYVVDLINEEGWRLVAEVDDELLDAEYFLVQVQQMKKAMQLPVFFIIYGLVWLTLSLLMSMSLPLRIILGLIAVGAAGYGCFGLITCFVEIGRIKKEARTRANRHED